MSNGTIDKMTIECWLSGGYYTVQTTLRIVISDGGGGRIDYEVDRYLDLSEDEALQLIEDISASTMPGSPSGWRQRSLFGT